MIDKQGRLWGRVSVIDLTAVLLVGMVVLGWVWRGSQTQAQTPQVKAIPLEFDMLVRGLSIGNPQAEFKPGATPRVVIRNQPAGQVTILRVKLIPNVLPVVLPSGKVSYVADQSSPYSRDILLTLVAQAQMTEDGAVVGGTKLKVATPIELEAARYNIKGSVIDLRATPQE
ncbi:DUF4330 domain-containing protein [Candidatus Cyanaurora vandensis]|uniref:DUF4330 domain-containing protein n=1 Tax=Candidatus Cyanaurora vandensis TaxID=2714958 RepID=UPI00257EEEDB|nr:DUF4330 domain-containing protein [Candidatus Cyanaurora vandensis]